MDATAIDEMLRAEFSTEDQRIFLEHFRCFLQYDQDKDHVIDFDKVYRWMGFTQKVNAKRLLLKHFNEGADYTTDAISFRTEELSDEDDEPTLGQPRVGRHREIIMLTPNAFKDFCLQAGTEKATRIRKYYRKMEEVVFKATQRALQTIHTDFTAQIKALEHALQKVERRKKFYSAGDTVYIVREYSAPNLYKIGSTNNMISRSSQYYTHSVGSVAIVYTRRCTDCRLIERVTHRRLFSFMYDMRPDWFQASFETIRDKLEETIMFVEGELSPDVTVDEEALAKPTLYARPDPAIDEAAVPAPELTDPSSALAAAAAALELVSLPKPERPTVSQRAAPIARPCVKPAAVLPPEPEPELPPLLEPPPPDFARFIEECYDHDADGKAVWIELTARYRLWSRNTQNVRDALGKYLDDAGYRMTYSYDRRTRVNAHAIAGLRMKPLPGFEVTEASSEVERFLHDECVCTVTARATILQLHGAFITWKNKKCLRPCETRERSSLDKLSAADKRALSEYCNRRFVPATVHDGARIRGGYYGLCLRGNEMVGVRTKHGLRKPVQQVDPSTQEVVRQYESVTEASKALRVTIARLSVAISGSRICNGFLFRLAL
jgi:hypothetical protein